MLADFTAYTGNFSTVAIQCLEKCPTDNSKFTFTCDRHTFNYTIDSGYSTCSSPETPLPRTFFGGLLRWQPPNDLSRRAAAFLAVAEEEYGRQIPFAFLERVQAEWKEKFADKARTATAHSLDKTFGCAPAAAPVMDPQHDGLTSLPLMKRALSWTRCLPSAGRGSSSTWNTAQHIQRS